MKIQIFASTRKKEEFIVLISAISLIGIISFIQLEPIIPDLSNPEELRALAETLGPYGPLGIASLQFFQVLLAPIPPFIPIVAGYIYGVFKGTFYATIGATFGTVLIIYLSRVYGRPFVEFFLTDQAIDKFDKYTKAKGFLPFIIIFFLPGFPDDALCFIAGLTKLDWKKLAFIGSLSRIPGIGMLAVIGSSVAEANLLNFILSSAALALISFLSIKYEESIENWLRNLEEESLMKLSEVMETVDRN